MEELKVFVNSKVPDWNLFDSSGNGQAACYIVGKHNSITHRFSSTKFPEIKGDAFCFEKSHFLFEGDIAPMNLSQGQSVFIVSEIHLREETSLVAKVGGLNEAKRILSRNKSGFYCKGFKRGGLSLGELFLDKLESAGSIPTDKIIDLQQLGCELYLLEIAD